MTVRKGQVLFRLLPLIAPERDMRVLTEKEFAEARTRVYAASVRLDRAEQLLRDKAGSVRQVEQAREEVQLAESALKTAGEKMQRMVRAPMQADTSLEIAAPQTGMIQKVHVGTQQKVAASTPLLDISSLDSLWVRVPVYVGAVGLIDRRRNAVIHNIADRSGTGVWASPVAAPPSANANAASVDLFYQLPGSAFSPGQKVGGTLTLLGSEESLVVPNSAIIKDVHGGEWVYENVEPQRFVRRRVEVSYVAGSQAVLSRGPAQGTRIVVTGAAELFSTEFNTGK
jgi:RND family efflux transporter MFP subunit